MKPIIIVDLEATCQEDNTLFHQEIIEIGAIRVEDGKIVDEFDIFVKPIHNNKLSEFCINLTHIKQEDIDSASSPYDAIKSFYDWATKNFTEDVVYLSWGGFDKKQLKKEINEHHIGFTYYLEAEDKHLNLKSMYPKILGRKRQMGTLMALKYEGFTFSGTNHRAIDDVKNIFKIYEKHRTKADKIINTKLGGF